MRYSRRLWLRALGVLCLAGAVLGFIWPVHALASRYYPLVFGIPFSLAWIVMGQVAVFLGLLALYRAGD